MTATNHAMTGAIIGLAVSNPVIAVPLAFASHYLLDLLPHSGTRENERRFLASKKFFIILLADILLCLLLALALFLTKPTNWFLAMICAFAATTPDMMWVSRLIAARQVKDFPRYKNPLVKLHYKIQWFQRPIGTIVEITWFLRCVAILFSIT